MNMNEAVRLLQQYLAAEPGTSHQRIALFHLRKWLSTNGCSVQSKHGKEIVHHG